MDKGLLVTCALAAIGLAALSPQIKTNIDQKNLAKAEAQQGINRTSKINMNAIAAKGENEIANKRMKSKCLFVRGGDNLRYGSNIIGGKPIVNSLYISQFSKTVPIADQAALYLQRGYVCDGFGLTAEIKFDPNLGYPVATDLAQSTDRAAIDEYLKSVGNPIVPGVNR
jgi:hypothetical protein